MSDPQSEDKPGMGFLYKTMRERDPKKRRVKPVANHLIQVDFEGDSDEDSDFDISKHHAAEESDEPETNENTDESEDGNSETDENDKDTDAAEIDNNELNDIENNSDETKFSKRENIKHNNKRSDKRNKSESSIALNDTVSSQSDDYEDDTKDETMKEFYYGNYLDDEDDADYVPKKRSKTKKRNSENKKSGKSETETVVRKRRNSSKDLPDKIKVSPRIKERKASTKASANFPKALHSRHLGVLVCWVCLVDNSEVEDEIVECDNCGACVHEGCYGMSDALSTSSSESTESTEPWFCDSCKAGVIPTCELCPNSGGIYKETDQGKWVHLVCALYIPGIAFGDVDKLTAVTLFEMPYSKWGAKQCSLCEDAALSSTGVCICCDAGMCRNYFHVTCAQRHGLLSQASLDEVHAIADPFFAYCKLHADKGVAQAKRRNWLALQSRLKDESKPDTDDKTKIRVLRKLEKHKVKYKNYRARRPPSWVPTTKMVRYLTSSPSVVRRMLNKAQLMGIITQVDAGAVGDQVDTRKKSVQAPVFTPDYISYYIERNNKITLQRKALDELKTSNNRLHSEEISLRDKYEHLEHKIEKLNDTMSKSKCVASLFFSQLSAIVGKCIDMPHVFRALRSPRSSPQRSSKREPIIHQCGICSSTSDQNLLAKCDSCKRYLHLGCLDPPLTRMPKKNKQQGWQCSECMESTSEESDTNGNIDVNAPRQLRQSVKGPCRFATTSQSSASDSTQIKKRKDKLKSRRRKKKSVKVPELVDETQPPKLKKEKSFNSPLKSKHTSIQKLKTRSPGKLVKKSDSSPNVRFVKRIRSLQRGLTATKSTQPPVMEPAQVVPVIKLHQQKVKDDPAETSDVTVFCCLCQKVCCQRDFILCDTCDQHYHFACLQPPIKTSPKRSGYEWHCQMCANLSQGEQSSDDDELPPFLEMESKLPSRSTRNNKDID